MSSRIKKDALVSEARRLAGVLDDLDKRARHLQSQHARRIGAQSRHATIWFINLDYLGKQNRVKRGIDKLVSSIHYCSTELEHFYELIGMNPESALAVVEISKREVRRISAELEALEGEQKGPGQEPSVPPMMTDPIQRTRLLSNFQIAYASRNDRHGEDAVREIQNGSGDLRGLILCDGITNADGALASEVIAESIQRNFQSVTFNGDLKALHSQLDVCLNRAVGRLRDTAKSKGVRESATTILLGVTDKSSFFLYYLGDGTLREYTEDAYSVADYLLTYERGGALSGYVSSSGIAGKASFVCSDSHVTDGRFLILATDGAELSNAENHFALGTILRETSVNGGQSLRDALEKYLDRIPDRADDSTIGAIWIRNTQAVH